MKCVPNVEDLQKVDATFESLNPNVTVPIVRRGASFAGLLRPREFDEITK